MSKTQAARAQKKANLVHARHMVAELARTARYWARDARRCLARGDGEGALFSFLISVTDRQLASGWRAEVVRLEGGAR